MQVDMQTMDMESAAVEPAKDAIEFGKEYLQKRIMAEFPLARHLGVVVEAADEHSMVLSAALAPNANHKGTAFGGSLFSIAVLTGWAWATRYLVSMDLRADAVIQESTMRYLLPVKGVMRARLVTPTAPQIEKFRKMLRRAGRGRVRLEVNIYHGDQVAAEFEGVFAATVR